MKNKYLFLGLVILAGLASCSPVPTRPIASCLSVAAQHQIGLIVVGQSDYLEILPKVGEVITRDLSGRGYRISFLKTEWAEEIIRPGIFFESYTGQKYDYFFLVKIVSLNITEDSSRKNKKIAEAGLGTDSGYAGPRLVKQIDKKCEIALELEIYDARTGLLLWQNAAQGVAHNIEEYPHSGTKSLDDLVETILKNPNRFDKIIEDAIAGSVASLVNKFVNGDIVLDVNRLVKVYLNVYEKKNVPINLLPGVRIEIIDRTVDNTDRPVERNLPDGLTIPEDIITKNTGGYDLELPEGYYHFVVTKDNTSVELFTLVIGQVRNIDLVLPEE
ncbi:MAG: DUF4136 domain-containing protein [Planctomycetota bacterium]